MVAAALDLVGLSDRAHHLPKQLSGGQEQRVAIARAIVTDPNLIVADEPTGNLDANSAEAVLDILRALSCEVGKTVIMVTHDPRAASQGTRSLHLEKGRLLPEKRTRRSRLMSLGGFIVKNALRNKRRSFLTVASVAISLFLFVTLQVAIREMTIPPEDVSASLRIAVRNKISLANPLPARQLSVISRMPGVAAVTPFTFFGGKFKDDDSLGFAQFAVDPEKFLQLFGEAKIPADQLEEWQRARDSCIVGKDTAKRYGLKVGDRVTLVGTILSGRS